MTKTAEQTYSSFNLLMKLLNVEIYTVIKDLKSKHVTLLMLQMCLTWLFFFFFPSMLCRSPPGLFQEQLQSSGAWRDIRGVCEENQGSWNFHCVTQGTNDANLFQGMRDNRQSVIWSKSKMLHFRCELCPPREHVERSSALWICRRSVEAGRRTRRLKSGKWMWCIYRASAQWLFDLPASSLPLPTTI